MPSFTQSQSPSSCDFPGPSLQYARFWTAGASHAAVPCSNYLPHMGRPSPRYNLLSLIMFSPCSDEEIWLDRNCSPLQVIRYILQHSKEPENSIWRTAPGVYFHTKEDYCAAAELEQTGFITCVDPCTYTFLTPLNRYVADFRSAFLIWQCH